MIIVTSKLNLKLFNLTLHCFPNQNNEGNKILCFRVTWIMDGCLSLEEGKIYPSIFLVNPSTDTFAFDVLFNKV